MVDSVCGGLVRSHSEGQSPVCQCGDDARLMTVRKEGPNTGWILLLLLKILLTLLLILLLVQFCTPSSNRQHYEIDNCLRDKREDY